MFSDDEYDDRSAFSEDSDLDIISDDDFADGFLSIDDSEVDNVIEPLRKLSTGTEQMQTALEEGIWDSLPEELVDRILTWLPPAALFRFRCVCKRWKSLSSCPGWLQLYGQVKSRPSCSIMCTLGDRAASFFCHSERRWFNLPPSPVSYLELQWELADADAGLVCYQCNWNGDLWMCVCNPLTQFSKLLPPNYPHWDIQPSYSEMLKLVVDKQTKTFKVVVIVHSSNPPSTVVYDSTTSLWTVCSSVPSNEIRSESLFVWKNVIYCQCFQANILIAFDIDSGIWSEVETDLPCHLVRRHFIVNYNGRILLIQMGFIVDEPISAWKLLKYPPSSSSPFSRSNWVKFTLNTPTNVRPLLSDVHACFSQSDRICFSTSRTNKWITYTFANDCCRVMPSWGKRMASYAWFDWEPRLDIDVQPDTHYENE